MLAGALRRKNGSERQERSRHSSEFNESREGGVSTTIDEEGRTLDHIALLAIIRSVQGSKRRGSFSRETSVSQSPHAHANTKSADGSENRIEENEDGAPAGAPAASVRGSTAEGLAAKMKRLWEPKLRPSTVCLCALWYIMNVASGWWTWAPIIAERYGITHNDLYTTLLVAKVFSVCAFLLAMIFVSFSFSSWAVVVANIGGALIMSALMAFFVGPAVDPIFFAILFWGFSLFFGGTWPIMYVVSPQAFPTISRGAGFGLASAFSKLGSISLPIFVGVLLDRSIFALGMLFTVGWGLSLVLALFQSKQPRYFQDQIRLSRESKSHDPYPDDPSIQEGCDVNLLTAAD